MRIESIAVVAFAVTCALPSCGGRSGRTANSGDASRTPDARALAVADAFIDDELDHAPDRVAHLRPPGARYDTLPDDSLAGIRAREARQDAWSRELEAIAPEDLHDRGAKLAWALAKEALDARRGARVCRTELWAVSQVGNGWQVRFADLAQAQPVGTPDLRQQALRRFQALPRWVDAHTENLREGLRLGYLAASVNVDHVLEQLDKLIAMPPRESPFFSPAARDPEPEFQRAFERIVTDGVQPALRAHREFLAREYRPRARTSVAVAANPNGAACYEALLRANTTLPLTPAEVHQTGRQQIDAIEAEMKALSEKSFGRADVKSLLVRFREDPQYRFADREGILRQAEDSVARARAALPQIVGRVPKGQVGVEPIPAFQEKTSPAHYLSAALDGSHPAAYRIRLYEPTHQNRVPGESVAFHETLPGHHLQIALANENEDNPRVARFHWVSAFGEGWALYAERVADELGLYTSDVDRFGMLSSAAFRATRLVVDTGLHALGWERQRAVDELLAHTASSPDAAAAEIDRYIAWPGQATSYMIGYLEIAALRAEAERALGAKFDRRAFHDRVLERGAVPLSLLRSHVRAYVAGAGD